jgi:CMP-N-acetylneuraminic acid synthetase
MNSIAFFLPTRKGSERVLNKNTRVFAGQDGGILKLKIQQLLEVPEIPIVLSTNDEESIVVAKSFSSDRIVVIERPDYLCDSSTIIEDFINYIPTVFDYSHIFWVHATAPFSDGEVYIEALKKYFEVINLKSHDSVISVNKIQQFLWDAETNNIINHNRNIVKWPRTQDLKPLYEINHAFYISSRDNYLRLNDRIGEVPYLYELDKLKSFDIDWEDDFKLAELLYEATRKV